MLKRKIFRSRWTALAWFFIMTILFFLPGSSFPTENWLSRIYFDKWVHVGLFAGQVFLWRSAFEWKLTNYNTWLFLVAVLYGFLVEVIQQALVPNRSFDLYDIISDTVGVALGLIVWLSVYKKNKPL